MGNIVPHNFEHPLFPRVHQLYSWGGEVLYIYIYIHACVCVCVCVCVCANPECQETT
jgi:hypothetical protein